MKSLRKQKLADPKDAAAAGANGITPSAPTGANGANGSNLAALSGNKAFSSTASIRSAGIAAANIGDGADGNGDDSDMNDWLPPRTLLKPADQLVLTDKELSEEFTRILNANNPLAPQNIARFNHKERVYKSSPNVDHLAVHFEMDGHLTWVEKSGDEASGRATTGVSTQSSSSGAEKPAARSTNESHGSGDAEDDEKGDANDPTAKTGPPKNQFTCSDRATQSFNHPMKERGSNTDPPPQRTFSDTTNQWTIYEAYIEDALNKERIAKEKAKAANAGKPQKGEEEGGAAARSAAAVIVLPPQETQEDIFTSGSLCKAARTMERMANQNTFDDVAQDFKYYEDASDEFREGKGTLLPLWKFSFEKGKKKQVTALCWNSKYTDLFVVGYGSYDFTKQGPGMICCFSLKNPSYPESTFHTESGVLCLHVHPKRPSYICVGLYDGSVCVYNIQKRGDQPIFRSNAKMGKHTDPVWQVYWQQDDLDDNPNFFSVSSDGRVTQWTLLHNELLHTDVIELRLQGDAADKEDKSPGEGEREEKLFGLAGGSCFDFHKSLDHLFVAGTEEGRIHKCSKAYNSKYLRSFEGHHMGVYAVRYNPHLHNVFLSASADWTVKLWDHEIDKPIMTFDLGSPVADISWAPYSSTVFAAVTADGKVYVYDLKENKHEPICEQQLVRKAKLTHVCFNAYEPVLLVGDDRGVVISYKLSPNLRKSKDQSGEVLNNIIQIALGHNPDSR